MSWGDVDGSEKLSASKYRPGQISNKNFDTVDSLTSFARTGGPGAEIDVGARTSGDFDMGCELL